MRNGRLGWGLIGRLGRRLKVIGREKETLTRKQQSVKKVGKRAVPKDDFQTKLLSALVVKKRKVDEVEGKKPETVSALGLLAAYDDSHSD